MATGTSEATDLPATAERRDRFLAYVIKAEKPAASRQLEDPFLGMYGEGLALEPDLDPERLILLADESSAHGACLDAKADDTVGRGWTLETTGSDRDDADVDPAGAEPADPADTGTSAATPSGTPTATDPGADIEDAVASLEAQLEALCPDYSFAELLWQATWERDAIGWAGWEMVPDESGQLAAMYPMPGHTIRCTRDRDVYVQMVGGVVRYFARYGSGKRINGRTGIGVDGNEPDQRRTSNDPGVEDVATEVLLFRGYSSRNRYYPIPRWVAAIPAIAELAAIRDFNVDFFGSGGVVDRLIHLKAGDESAAKTLASEVKEAIDAAKGGAHLTIVTGGDKDSGADVEYLTPTQGRRDGQFNTRRADLTDEVLMAHKVPAYRVAKAVVGSLGGAPTRDMLHTYRIGTIEPAQGKLEHILNATLFGPKGLNLIDKRWRLEDLDWDETELDLKIAQGIVDSGIGCPDEGREVMGLGATGRPEMLKHYYKGVELGAPRPAGGGGFGGPAALSEVDRRLQAARARAAAKPANSAPAGANGNGHSTADLGATVPVA